MKLIEHPNALQDWGSGERLVKSHLTKDSMKSIKPYTPCVIRQKMAWRAFKSEAYIVLYLGTPAIFIFYIIISHKLRYYNIYHNVSYYDTF